MIDREKLEKVAQAMDALQELGVRSTCDIKTDSDWDVWAWCYGGIEEGLRRKVVAVLTPLVGKMTVEGISWVGKGNGMSVRAHEAQACKVVGYRKVKKRVPVKEVRVVEREEEVETGEYAEEEVDEAVTDCDIKSGKVSESEIGVPA